MAKHSGGYLFKPARLCSHFFASDRIKLGFGWIENELVFCGCIYRIPNISETICYSSIGMYIPSTTTPPSGLNVTVCGLHFSDMCSVWYYITHNQLLCSVHLMGWGWNRDQARGKRGRRFLCTGYVSAELNMPGKTCRFSKCNFIHCRVRSSRLSSFLQFTQYMFVSLKNGYFYTLVGRLKTILISSTKFG